MIHGRLETSGQDPQRQMLDGVSSSCLVASGTIVVGSSLLSSF